MDDNRVALTQSVALLVEQTALTASVRAGSTPSAGRPGFRRALERVIVDQIDQEDYPERIEYLVLAHTSSKSELDADAWRGPLDWEHLSQLGRV